MGSIVNDICSALLNLIMKICLQVVDFTISLVSGVGIDTSILDKLAPNVIENLYSDVFIPLGWGIALLLLITGLVQFMFPFLNKNSLPADSVLILFVRFAISIILIVFLKGLVNDYITPFVSTSFDYISSISTEEAKLSNVSIAVDLNTDSNVAAGTLLGTGATTGILSIFASGALATILQTLTGISLGIFVVALILVIYLSVVCIKYLMYHLEMLIQTALLILSAPLVAGTYTSKQTSNMLFMWLKMILKNFVCLVYNILIIKIMQAICANGVTQLKVNGGGMADSLFLVLLIPILIATLNVGKKMSIYIGQLFNVNGMGDAIRDGVGGLGRTVMSLGGMAMAGGRAIKGDMRQKKTMEMQQSQHEDRMAQSDSQHQDRMNKMDEANAQRAQDIANREAKQAKSDADKDITNKHNMSPEAREMYENLRNNGSSPQDAKTEVESRGFDSAVDKKDWKNLSPESQDMIDKMAAENNEDFFDAYNEGRKAELSANNAVTYADACVKGDNYGLSEDAKEKFAIGAVDSKTGVNSPNAQFYESTQQKALSNDSKTSNDSKVDTKKS